MASLQLFLFCNRDALGDGSSGFVEDNAMGHSPSYIDFNDPSEAVVMQPYAIQRIPPLRPMKSLPVSSWGTLTKRKQNGVSGSSRGQKQHHILLSQSRKMVCKQHRSSIPSSLFPVTGKDTEGAVSSSSYCRWDNGLNAKETDYLDFFRRTRAMSVMMKAAHANIGSDCSNFMDRPSLQSLKSSAMNRGNLMNHSGSLDFGSATMISNGAIGGNSAAFGTGSVGPKGKGCSDSAPRLPCRAPAPTAPMRRASSDGEVTMSSVGGSGNNATTSKHCSDILTEALALVMFDDDDDEDYESTENKGNGNTYDEEVKDDDDDDDSFVQERKDDGR